MADDLKEKKLNIKSWIEINLLEFCRFIAF